MNYYNENDKHAAQWLRNLILGGMLPPGDVDQRSITDVRAIDLKGYTQCHFFAGIGGWSEALRIANWPTDRPVWTGSCPCQSFSVAGKGKGVEDERHLWPVWFELIKERRPPVIFGEQVEAAIRYNWLNIVQNDLEAEDYACGAIVLPACGVGAPHIRQRLWFMAHRIDQRSQGRVSGRTNPQWEVEHRHIGCDSSTGGLGDSHGLLCNQGRECRSPEQKTESEESIRTSISSSICDMADSQHNGHWGNADWIYCRDEKFRAVEPRTLPLAHGVQGRVVKIRGYGNAIVPQVAAEVIKTGAEYLELIK